MIKKIALGLVFLVLAGGIFLFVQLERRMYAGIVLAQSGVADLVNFVKIEFPNQVADYQTRAKAQSAPAPTNAPVVAPKK